jgi:hypothetical protein
MPSVLAMLKLCVLLPQLDGYSSENNNFGYAWNDTGMVLYKSLQKWSPLDTGLIAFYVTYKSGTLRAQYVHDARITG